jgi:hypothetical protein
VYERRKDDIPNEHARAELARSSDEIHPDCRIMAAGDTPPDPLEQLHDAFMTNIGMPSSPPTTNHRVMVAIIDDATPAGNGTTHGAMMSNLVENIISRTDNVVPGPPGMPGTRRVEVAPILMGYPATQSDLVNAIGLSLAQSNQSKLVINLSLGWEALADDTLVHLALTYARCKGALVFAAVGNKAPGTCESQQSTMLWPAAWYTQTTNCSLLNTHGRTLPVALHTILGRGAGQSMTDSSCTGPLVRAVSAVDEFDQPLLTNRSNVGLTALGRLAVAKSSEWVGPITGTSVSTAVVSAIAAVRWSMSDDATVTGDAIAGLLSTASPVKACTTWGLPCPEKMTTTPNAAWKTLSQIHEAMALTMAVNSTETLVSAGTPMLASPPTVASAQPLVCSRSRMIFPQPPDPPCKGCSIKPLLAPEGAPAGTADPDDTLTLMLSDSYRNYFDKLFTVELTLDPAGPVHSYTVQFRSGAATIYGPYWPATGLSHAWVTMYFPQTDGSLLVASNEIPIYEPQYLPQ